MDNPNLIGKTMKIAIVSTIMAMGAALGFCGEHETRIGQAASRSSDIVVARILETSPVGHGTNGVTVSFQVQPIRHLKGTNSLSGAWITYSVLEDRESFGTDHETSLKKNDERIFFITNGTLLRAEVLDQESLIQAGVKIVPAERLIEYYGELTGRTMLIMPRLSKVTCPMPPDGLTAEEKKSHIKNALWNYRIVIIDEGDRYAKVYDLESNQCSGSPNPFR